MSQLRYPIFIPSRGRASCAVTPGVLERDGLEYTLVVEPDEEQEYRRAFPKADVLTLPECDRGMWYVRSWLMDYTRRENIAWFWAIDDNVRAFSRVANQRCTEVPASEALGYAETFTSERVALVSLAHRTVAWSCRCVYTRNGASATSCILTRSGTQSQYRESVSLKEDIDYTLQVLREGWNTVYVALYAQDKKQMKANSVGGCVDWYRNGADKLAVAEMCRLWPGICKPVQKYGRLDLTVDWKRAASRYGVRI